MTFQPEKIYTVYIYIYIYTVYLHILLLTCKSEFFLQVEIGVCFLFVSVFVGPNF